MNRFRYILRYCITPGYAEDERIAELAEACKCGRIEEVMLFFNAEESCVGHFTFEELDRWLAMALKVKAVLNSHGIDLSVNPWVTTCHVPRGRKLRDGQDFTLMVGESGKDNGVTVCPMCENWQKYICELWAKVAEVLKPTALWIEDDWRLHNHGDILGAGGCFCKLHLAEFARRVGREVSREEILNTVFGPGEVHPWRTIWLDINRDAFDKPLKMLHDAIHAANPSTRLAMMCGGIDIAGAEGRDWHATQNAAGFEPEFMIRPSLYCYTERWMMTKNAVGVREVMAVLEKPYCILPEFESAPRNGSYSKGCDFAKYELLEAAAVGSHGITMNHYDMMGCGTILDRKFPQMLGKVKPRLNALRTLEISEDNAQGAVIPVHPAAARYMHSNKPGTIRGLLNFSTQWGKVGSILGFSTKISAHIPEDTAQPLLFSSQTLRCYSDDELQEILKHPLLLDADAAEILLERGFAENIGIKSSVLHEYDVSDYSYEEICEEDKTVYGIACPRMTAQRAAWSLRAFTPADGAQTLSFICAGDGRRMFPGALLYGDKAVLAYPMGDGHKEEWFYMGFFNIFRQQFLFNIMRTIAPEMRGAFCEAHPFCVYRTELADGSLLVSAFNNTSDEAEELPLIITGVTPKYRCKRLNKDGEWEEVKDILHPAPGGVRLLWQHSVAVLEGEFFRIYPEN